MATETRKHPEMMKFDAIKEKDLGAMIDTFVGCWRLKDHYKSKVRSIWEALLPLEIYDPETKTFRLIHENWTMAYVPKVDKKKAYIQRYPRNHNGSEDLANWPYFFVLKNSGRDNRPQEKVPEGEDMLQKNNVDTGLLIAEIDGGKDGSNFYFGPNLYPYDYYASLLISDQKRPQERVKKEDIVTWIKFSFLTGLSVFFNSHGAGATRLERFHAQVVDEETLNFEDNPWSFPIKNKWVEKEPLEAGVYELRNYAAGALLFTGKGAPGKVADLVEAMEGTNKTPYNIIIDGTDVYVIPRNRNRERSDCIGKNLGGLEMLGEIPVGNIEEPVLGKAGLDRFIHAEDVFRYLKYETIVDNISAACIPTRWLTDLYKGEKNY